MDPALIPALYDAITVARTGSVSEAARRLNKTSSAVSQQIRHLSETLGVALFERRGRGLALTRAAEQVLPAATRLFDEADALFRVFAELSGTSSTTLRLAASDYLARPLLVPVLRDLSEEGAPLHFEISTAHSEEALQRVERGDVEMAIVSFGGERVGLRTELLFEQPFYWVMPAATVNGTRTLRERLLSEPLLRLAPGSLGRKLLDQHLDQHAIRPVSTIDVPSVSLLLTYARGGVGIGLVPALALEGDDRRIQLQPADVEPLPVKLVMRQGFRLAPAVQRFHARLLSEAAQQRLRLHTAAALMPSSPEPPPSKRGNARDDEREAARPNAARSASEAPNAERPRPHRRRRQRDP